MRDAKKAGAKVITRDSGQLAKSIMGCEGYI